MLSPAGAAPAAERPRSADAPVSPRPRWAVDERWIVAAVWIVSALWMLAYLRRGWVPHDEGTVAQSAARVLRGELPHRDFVDLYTGALSYLNALSFRLFGETLLAPRIALLLVALLWVPAVYAVARRFLSPLAAGGTTLLAVAWSLPNYFAALPSWYNLVLATFGLAALLRGLRGGGRSWLAAAGACGGVSVLFKLPGLFFIAAGLLAIAYAEQSEAAEQADPEDTDDGPNEASAYALFLAVCALGLAAAVALLVRSGGITSEAHLAVPVAALGALLVWNERAIRGASGPRFRALFGRALPFLAGAAAPLLLFGLAYALSGALPALLNGVFVLPRLRVDYAAAPMPGVLPMLVAAALPALALVMPLRTRPGTLVLAAAGLVLAAILVVSGIVPALYSHVFVTARAVIPLAAVGGAVALARSTVPAARRAEVFAVIAVAALCALVQFPFGVAVYFCYVAPLGVLAVAAALSLRKGGLGPAAALLLGFYLAFAAAWVNRAFIFEMAARAGHPEMVEMGIPRAGGIRVPPDQAAQYRSLVEEMGKHARGSFIYAGPDAPEVYFLAGYRNPTPQLFEFFDAAPGHEQRLLAALDRAGVTVIALNRRPWFSPFPSEPTLVALRARYPHATQVGAFVVAWREPGDAPAAR